MRCVAGALEDALAEIFGESIAITAAGRTDAGVHATGQVISCALPRAFSLERLGIALGAHLPRDVAVREIEQVPDDFSARHSARARTYVYAIHNARVRSPLLDRYAWHVRGNVDVVPMRVAAAQVVGKHDFRSFCALPEHGSTVRCIRECTIERHGNLVRVSVTADGFLHHMVRTLVGTLVECAQGRRDAAAMTATLQARERASAGVNAPPQGLYLAGVRYDDYDSYREPWLFAQTA